jgi:DNA polymerase/3'-5' exonuclease PolX
MMMTDPPSPSSTRLVLRDVLAVVASVHGLRGDAWKSAAYTKGAEAVASVIRMPDLDKPEDAAGVGASIGKTIRKVRASIEKNTAQRKDAVDLAVSVGSVGPEEAAHLRAYRAFLGILGVGDKKANELARAGYRSVDDVRRDRQSLDLDRPVHAIGLRYYQDLRSRIPYARAKDVASRVKTAIQECRIVGMDTTATASLGSLRRRRPDVGDIDLLVLASDDEGFRALARRMPRALKGDFLVALSGGDRRYSFVMLDRGRAYQVDVFRAKDRTEWASYLLYGTGSAGFNERVRAEARKRGFLLNEYGLYTKHDPADKTKKKKIPLAHEADIFAHLGMPYVPPRERR